MDQYYARKRQLGGGFNVTIPVAVGDSALTLKAVKNPVTYAQLDDVARYTIHVQRIQITVVTGSGGKTWSVGAYTGTEPRDLTGAKSVATSNTVYTYDFGPSGMDLGEDQDLELLASAAGAVGFITVEGYQSRLEIAANIFQVDLDTGTTAGGVDTIVNVTPTETGCRVFFGDDEATIVSVDEATETIHVLTPAHAAGVVDVTVLNPSRLIPIVLVDGYTYS
jgi:hypothetical protein